VRLLVGDTGNGEPLTRGLVGRWRGRVAFSALSASLGPLDLRPLSGVLRSDGDTLTFDALKASLGGGTVTGDIVARAGGEGIALDGRLQLTNVDGAVLRLGQLALPSGRVTAQLSIQGAGRSPASLIGSLSGTGTVKLESTKLAGLDPAAFDAAIRVSDQGVTDAARLRDATERALAAGALNISGVEFPLTLRAGRLRLDNTTAIADAAQLAVSGSYDLAAADLDLRASLVSTAAKGPPAAGRPEIRVALRGPADAPVRSVDTSPLIGWIAVRAIDRETQRLDQLDRNAPPRTQAPASPASPPSSTASVPPAETPAESPATATPDAPAPIIAPATPAPALRPGPRRAPTAPQGAPEASTLPPLPPPIDVRPAPAVKRQAPPQPAPRPPQSILPNAQRQSAWPF
jgi:large subunit ribosomal protein L24